MFNSKQHQEATFGIESPTKKIVGGPASLLANVMEADLCLKCQCELMPELKPLKKMIAPNIPAQLTEVTKSPSNFNYQFPKNKVLLRTFVFCIP